MNNLVLCEKLLSGYEKFSATNLYILGFEYNNKIWACFVDSSVLPFVTRSDFASREKGYSLRLGSSGHGLNIAQKEYIISKSVKNEILCSIWAFEREFKEFKGNQGEFFEKKILNLFGYEWKRNPTEWWKDGDIRIDGVPYQIKFNNATFTHEKQLSNLEKQA
jgi:hypothetical protein